MAAPADNTLWLDATDGFLPLTVSAPAEAIVQFPDYRLSRLVIARLGMNSQEAGLLARLTGSRIALDPVLQAVESIDNFAP